MPSAHAISDHPPAPAVKSLDDLLQLFFEAQKPREQWRVGLEAERFGVLRPEWQPMQYEGDCSVSHLFTRLVNEHGWVEKRETPGGPVVALTHGALSITLEPGAQMELSGAPHATVHNIIEEWNAHFEQLRPLSDELGIEWLGLGFHPFASHDELPRVPKLRYPIMREFLPATSPDAHNMMQRTCTVQANFDFASEDDAMRKVRAALRVHPIVTAMFSNSPWVEGAQSGFVSRRAKVWTRMGATRCGLLPFAWGDHARYLDYVEWALDAPMFLVQRPDGVKRNTGQSFRDFMANGFEGVRATTDDWRTHLATLFPEVRLKSTIEVRGADAQHEALTWALPALWRGLLYDDTALGRLETLVDSWTHNEVQASREALAERGVRARFLGRDVAVVAGDVLEIAESGLQRLGQNEAPVLQPLRALLGQAKSPADALLERVPEARPSHDAVVEAARLLG